LASDSLTFEFSTESPANAKHNLLASDEYLVQNYSTVKKLPFCFDIFSPLTITQPLQKIPFGRYYSPQI